MVDFNIHSGASVLSNDKDLVLQQIDLLFDTRCKDVLGYEEYGSTYDKYLYTLKVDNESLRNKVLSDLYSINLQGFTPEVSVYFLEGSERDIAIIDITLTKNYETYNKTYKIQ
jgi:hypothetical protein